MTVTKPLPVDRPLTKPLAFFTLPPFSMLRVAAAVRPTNMSPLLVDREPVPVMVAALLALVVAKPT